MPYADPDPTDPMTLHGVAFETPDDSACIDMVLCFIEEYARLGFDADRILRIFRNPGYVGPYGAFCELGENAIKEMIAQEFQCRPSMGAKPLMDAVSNTGEGYSLPVIQAGF